MLPFLDALFYILIADRPIYVQGGDKVWNKI